MKKLIEQIKKLVAFARSVASESDGSGSASRIISLVVTTGGIAALLLVTIAKKELPTGDQLAGLAKVIGMGNGAYAFNQIKNGWTEGK